MKYLLIALFLLLIPMLLANSADACQYIPSNNTLQEDFEEYDFVFSGKILTVGKYTAYTPVTLEIIDQWKGEPHEKIYLFVCAGKNSGGLQFQEGETYLIFAEKLTNNVEPIVTDFGPTKLLSTAKKDTLFLDQQTHITRFTYEPAIEQKPNYQFIDFSYANKSGESIQFILEKTAKNQCNSYTAIIIDEDDDIVWTQQRGSLCVITNDSSLQTSQIKLGYDTNNPIIIDKSGTYLIKVQIDDKDIEQEFIVRQNHTGISLDRITYPVSWIQESPLKQFKFGIPADEIQCRESLDLMTKHDGSPACVKEQSVPKLIERGWIKNNNSNKATFDDYIIDCNNQTNPYQEYECFKDAYSNCYIATVNPEIYTIEGDPIYTTLTITPDCKVQGIADMSTDRFWGTPEIITTQCDRIVVEQYTWEVQNCDAEKLPRMQFNFQMQLYPQILECEENDGTWIHEKLECARDKENEN